jgi:hypothetical protein
MTDTVSKAGLFGSIAALFTAACCVLPMTMMVLGLGGSWIAVFGQIAAYSAYIGLAAVGLLTMAWVLAWWRRAGRNTYVMLGIGSALSALGWAVFFYEGRINDLLITIM